MQTKDFLVIRPILKIAGGRIELSHWSGQGSEVPARRLEVGGDPDHDWPELFLEVSDELAAGRRGFILDLDRVPWMNSRGLGRLVALWRTIDDGGGRLAVVCGIERIRNILRISQLDELLRPLESLEAAGRSLSEGF